MGKYIRGTVDETLALGTLAGNTLVKADFDDAVTERSLISSLVASYSITNVTQIADMGPLVVGVAHSDYSAAEIEEWIENSGAWSEGDKVSQEVAKRQIRVIGIFNPRAGTAAGLAADVLNDGKKIKTKLNWILNSTQTLTLWVHNRGTAAVATTIPDVHVMGHANIWPR